MNKKFTGKRSSNIKKYLGIVFCAVIILTTQPKNIYAYDNDTHFWLTYYLAVKAGYTPIQATQIASANISVDLDNDTDPVLPQPNSLLDWRNLNSHFQYVRRTLHALPSKAKINELSKQKWNLWWNPLIENDQDVNDIAAKLVSERKAEFWTKTLKQGKNPGVFLHYLQDTFAHENFKSYIGHAGYYYVDFLASDREKAERMAFRTYQYLRSFHETKFNKKDFSPVESVESSEIDDEIEADIREILDEFYSANPSDGRSNSPLIDIWENLKPEVQRKKYKRPPNEYFRAFWVMKSQNPAPNSSKARFIILTKFGLEADSAPLIWKYNLRKSGDNKDKFSATAFEYKINYDPKDAQKFTSSLEKGNHKRKTYPTANASQCLAFELVDNSLKEIPKCGSL